MPNLKQFRPTMKNLNLKKKMFYFQSAKNNFLIFFLN
jgi:hypothetical protein